MSNVVCGSPYFPSPTFEVNNLINKTRFFKMQEPLRLSLLNTLQKSFKQADKKSYIHRFIYIGDYVVKSPQDSGIMLLIFESNIKLINDESSNVPLTGFGLFYEGYFINIIEGTEECIAKHLKTLLISLNQNVSNSPPIKRMKTLIISHHIIKRNFANWCGRPATPPVLLEKIEPTTDHDDVLRQIHTCIKKLYRMSDFLANQPAGLIKATMDNISQVCQQYLPEFNLLEFLLETSALVDVSYYASCYDPLVETHFPQDVIWPIPTDFVPYNIVGSDRSKVLMYLPKSEDEIQQDAGNSAAERNDETNADV